MILDILAWFLIAVPVAIAISVLLLFIILVEIDFEPKKALPLLAFALLLAGFVWALFRLGVM